MEGARRNLRQDAGLGEGEGCMSEKGLGDSSDALKKDGVQSELREAIRSLNTKQAGSSCGHH